MIKSMPARQRGFTLTEVVIVLLLAGILSAFAATRLIDTREVQARGFADQVAATLRFAQKAAIAQRRTIHVDANTTLARVRACLDAGCSTLLAAPAGGSLAITAASGVSLAAATTAFSFDALGRPSVNGLTLTATGNGASFAVTVEAQTGYVRAVY